MKTLITLSITLAIVYPVLLRAQAQAQEPHPDTTKTTLLFSKQPGEFPVAIETVLHDFPDNFRHITGQLVLAQGETENYASLVGLPGATSCIITRYHSREDTTASWQARMYQGDHFGEASRIYGELYGKLKNCTLQLPDGGILYLKGEWNPAKEEAAFTTSSLKMLTGDPRYKYLKIEIELVYQVSDWIINVNIMSKKPDEEAGGGVGGKPGSRGTRFLAALSFL